MSSDNVYDDWKNICKYIVSNKIIDWKQDKNVTYMLEHLGIEYAEIYLQDLLNEGVNIYNIQKLCEINDKYGNANIKQFDNGLRSSTSSVRYVRHALDICNLIKSKNYKKVNIVEGGGGYGGLCVILNNLANTMNISISKYFIYDLEEIQRLQHYYLCNFVNIDNVRFKSCNTFGSNFITEDGEVNILVSCYCLSEIKDEYKNEYLKNLLPKVHGGFLAWNFGSKEGLPKDATIVPEIPDTGEGNTIITW
jgi:hypothetical protein